MSWIEMAMRGATASEMAEVFPWADDMDACRHDPVHHAEGSPWVHTGMVAAALEREPRFLALPEDRRAIVRLAAWCHDIAKPWTTEVEADPDGGPDRVRQPGHAALGAKTAYQALIDAGTDIEIARDVHALVFWHMRPAHLVDQGPDRLFHRALSYSVEAGGGSWTELLALTRADQAGRISLSDADKTYPIDLLELALDDIRDTHEVDLERGGWPFASDTARLTCLRGGPAASAYYTPIEPAGSDVVVMSGLPGSGKDTIARRDYPDHALVSLDVIRERLGVAPQDNQGRVIQAGFEEARHHLRRGAPFVWNATCLMRTMREKIVGIARDYDARITAVSIDVPEALARRRNAGRDAPVPGRTLATLAAKREPVMADEAHCLVSIDADGAARRIFGTEPDRAPAPEIA